MQRYFPSSTVVIDTSVLISDPASLDDIPAGRVIIPLVVIEELDGLKVRHDDTGRAARHALRRIELLRQTNSDRVVVDIEPVDIPHFGLIGLDVERHDNLIIGCALRNAARILSNDAALRIKASELGVDAAEYVANSTGSVDTEPAGWRVIEVPAHVIDMVYADKCVEPLPETATPNEFYVLRSGSQSALTQHRGGKLRLLTESKQPWGLQPRNKEQRFAIELLMNPDISVVALDGRAGTGKTILAAAAALEQAIELKQYDSVAIYRPIIPVGRADLGFLPGDMADKLGPWMAAIMDALAALHPNQSGTASRMLIEELTGRGQLTMESVTFLRGRSLQRQFIIVDEAQNLEPTTLKTILTRIGDGSKVVFTGDTSQIDAPYLSESRNALARLTEAFARESLFGHLTLTECERSKIAALASELL